MSFIFSIFSKIGSLFSRLKRKKTTLETLEELEKKIKECENHKKKNEQNERKFIGALVLYSIVFYIIGAFIYYIYLMPKNFTDRFKSLLPFLISPLLIIAIRKLLKWIFIKKINYYEKKLSDLKEEKKIILEQVKEKETYKKAREILDRFSAETSITPPTTPSQNITGYSTTPFINKNDLTHNTSNVHKVPSSNIVHRSINQFGNGSMNTCKLEPNASGNQQQETNKSTMAVHRSNMSGFSKTPSFQTSQHQTSASFTITNSNQARTLLPRPIVTPNRTFFDKLLDFLIGEGPNNRYALICKSCHFHNGMALKEEFEYVAFRCAYCLFYNEARKSKLIVPKLTDNITLIGEQTNQFDDTRASNSSNNFNETNELIEDSTLAPLLSSDKEKESRMNRDNKQNSIEKERKGSFNESLMKKINIDIKKSSKSLEKLNDLDYIHFNKKEN